MSRRRCARNQRRGPAILGTTRRHKGTGVEQAGPGIPPDGGTVALQARAVAKRFRGGVRALDGIDLDIPAGSICALVGPNGAGKSTLMKAWVGFERPSSGSVAVFGINPWRNKPAALDRIGYVSQKPALYRGLTVADHVALAGSLRPNFDPGLAERRLDELAIPLGQDAKTLSGGQQAQVMLALALGTHAQVFILDEPLASLDPLARREFLHVLVDAVRADGATAVLSSHVITDIVITCEDRTAVAPSARTASTRTCRNSRRASGSRLASGSSRMNTWAWVPRARASMTWACWPPDSVRVSWPSGIASSSRRRSARPGSKFERRLPARAT